jgi:hypothetical protein
LLGSTCTARQSKLTPSLRQLYLSISLVDARQIDLGSKGDLRRHVGVVWPTVDLDTIDAVLVDTLSIRQTQAQLSTVEHIRVADRGWYRSSQTS